MAGLQPAGLLRPSTKYLLARTLSKRSFSCCVRCAGVNPLLNLAGWSGSKEAQYFSKERKIPRVEFSPHLELIRSSEVDPFAPAPGASATVISALKRARSGQSDMQTAYTLAVTNLAQQLEYSRRETREATIALNNIYDKYKKQERQALVVMLTAVALLSLAVFWPNFVQDTWDDLQALAQPKKDNLRHYKMVEDRGPAKVQTVAPPKLLEVTKKMDVKQKAATATKPPAQKPAVVDGQTFTARVDPLQSSSTTWRMPSLSGLFWKS